MYIMISPDLLERLIQATGGRFRLTTLIQKRAREICLGAPPLVKPESDRPHEIAMLEIAEGRIYLAQPGEDDAESGAEQQT